MDISINSWAVLAAAIINIIIGMIWYSPPVFGKLWMSSMGLTPQRMEELKKRGMGKIYFASFVTALLMSYVLAHFVKIWAVEDIGGALQLSFWSWLGFVVTVSLGSVLWEGKSFRLYLLNIAYQFVSIFVMAVILAIWV